MNKKTFIITFIAFFVLISGFVTLFAIKVVLNNDKKDTSTTSNILGTQEESFTISITTGEDNTKEYKITKKQENFSLYDYLAALDKDESKDFSISFEKFSFDGKDSFFVTSINGLTPNSSKQFWKLIKNGDDAQVGINDIYPQSDDKFEFIVDDIIF